MAKNKNQKHGDAEDYLAQVEWENQQLQRQPYTPLPSYMAPKWKYKKSLSSNANTGKNILIPIVVIFAILCVGIGYFFFKNNLYILIILLAIGLCVFLAIRDASTRPRDDN